MLGPPPPDERTPPDLTNGGVLALILGNGDDVPTDYAYNPRVVPIFANKLPLRDVDNKIPGNVRVAVFAAGWVQVDLFQAIHAVLKRRRLPYVVCKAHDSVRRTITQLLPTPSMHGRNGERLFVEPTVTQTSPPDTNGNGDQPKRRTGSVKAFVIQHLPALLAKDAQMPAGEAAAALFKLAEADGLKTTLGSLSHTIYLVKRDGHIGERTPSAQPPATKVRVALAHALMSLEAATEHVKSIQAEYDRVLAENQRLRAHQVKAAEVFKVFQRDVLGDNEGDS